MNMFNVELIPVELVLKKEEDFCMRVLYQYLTLYISQNLNTIKNV